MAFLVKVCGVFSSRSGRKLHSDMEGKGWGVVGKIMPFLDEVAKAENGSRRQSPSQTWETLKMKNKDV